MKNGKTFLERIDLANIFDPRLFSTPSKKGTLFRVVPDSGPPILLMKQDDGASTNWLAFATGGSGWLLTGNLGSGHQLGTLTSDDFEFITNAITRAGFKAAGEFFLKTHTFYPDSESITLTNAISTLGTVPGILFEFLVPDSRVGLLDVKIQGRSSGGVDTAAFHRAVKFSREEAGAVVSTKVHTHLTDKSNSDYNAEISASGNNVRVLVNGAALQQVNWSGTLNYQMIGEP